MRSTGNPAWDLAIRLKAGEPLVLTARVVATLRSAGRDVGIEREVIERALRTTESARKLLWRIRARYSNSSLRLMRALDRMYTLRDKGDLEGARQQMRDVLAKTVVKHHRRVAQGQLDQLDDWKQSPKRNATTKRATKTPPPTTKRAKLPRSPR